MAKKKFDTNPLDPEFPERVRAAQKADTTPNLDAKTQTFPPASVTEEPTRRYENPNFAPPYSPPFNGQNVPGVYQTSRLSGMNSTDNRKVEKIGLSENVLAAVPYIPFYLGLIAGILLLLFAPKSEAKVRFHAAQGLAAHIAILIITTVLGGIGNIPGMGFVDAGNWIFQLVTTIMLIVFTIKAWQGKPVHIESVDDLTEWLEDKIQPRN